MRIDLRLPAWSLAAVAMAASASAGEPPVGDATEVEPTPVSRVERPTEGLPAGAILRIGERCFRHGDAITALAFAADGRTLYSAGRDAAVRAWELPSGKERFAIRLTDGQSVDDLVLSPDGSRLVAACGGGTVVEWGSADGAFLRKTASEQALTRLACTPDGRHLLTVGSDGTLFVRNAATCETIRPLKAHADEVCSPAASPDGTRIYSGGDDRKVRAWDLATGTLLGTWTEHTDTVTAVVVSPDGRCLATGDDEGVVFLRDPDSGRIRRRIAWDSESVAALAFSPDGGQLAVATGHGILLVSVPSGEIIQTLVRPGEDFTVLAFAPRGDALAAAAGNRILFWDLVQGPVMIENRFGAFGEGVLSMAMSPDGLQAAVQTQDRGIVIWDVAADREIRRIDHPAEPLLALAFSPDGAFLAVGVPQSKKSVRVWDVATGDARRELDTDGHSLLAFEFVPGGHRLAVSCEDGRMLIWDVASGARVAERKVQEKPAAPVTRMKPVPDGSALLVGSADGALDVFTLPTLDRVRRLAKCDEAVSAVAFSADGRRVVTGDDSGNVRVWDVADGRRLFEGSDRLNGSGIVALAFVPGSERFVSLSRVSEEPWALWDPAKPAPAEPETFRGGTGDTDMASVLPDGRIVTGTGGMPHLSLWRPGVARRARARAQQGFDKPFDRVLFSADGRTLVAEEQDAKHRGGFLSFFDAGNGQATGATSAGGSALLDFACTPDGGVAAVFQDGRLRSWSLPGGGLVADLEMVRGDALMAAAISADGRRVVAAAEEKMIHWDVPGRRTLRELEVTPNPAGYPTSLACSTDGLSVVRFLANNLIDVWDLETGLKTVEMPVPGSSGLGSRLMPDGATILIPDRDAGKGVQLVDVATRKAATRLKAGSGNRVALAIRPDGAAVATTADSDGIALWEPWTGTRLHAFDRTTAAVLAMAFSPDGSRLAAACADATLLVFDVSPWAGDPLPGIPATRDGMMEDWAAMGRDAEDATGAYQAMARMAGRGDGAVLFLSDRLQAAPAAPDRLPRWLRELDDEAVEVRERAMEEMKGLGPEAEPALREARARVRSPEVLNRLDRILEGLSKRPPSEDGLRRIRAVRVLGRIGTPAALRALEAVVERSIFRAETGAARCAIERIQSRRPGGK